MTALEADPIAPVRDKVILATAGILDMAGTFYANYRGFLADADQGMAFLVHAPPRRPCALRKLAARRTKAIASEAVRAVRSINGDSLLNGVELDPQPSSRCPRDLLQRPC